MMVLNGEVSEGYLAERIIMGFDHAAVGGALLQKWDLPLHLNEAVAFHHEPEGAEDYPLEAALIHVSNRIASMAQLDTTNPDDVPPVNPDSLALLSLSNEDMPEIVPHIQRAILDVEDALFGSS